MPQRVHNAGKTILEGCVFLAQLVGDFQGISWDVKGMGFCQILFDMLEDPLPDQGRCLCSIPGDDRDAGKRSRPPAVYEEERC